MPLYFFDVLNDEDLHPDSVGVELRDDAEARCEAVGIMQAVVREADLSGGSAVVAIVARNAASGEVIEVRCEITVR